MQAIRLRRVASGLLLVMALLLLFSHWAIDALHPGFVWVRAFAEAALVGGLADWFAVTALFRYPMGLPIPHTAIIPRSKDRIGEALASFLKDNFLTPRNVARRLDGFDAANAIAGVLERPASGGRVRRSLMQLADQLSATPAAQSLFAKLKEGALSRLREMEVSPLLGRMLAALIADGRHRPVIDELIRWADRTLDSQEGLIRAMVEERTSWMLRLVNVDQKIADELVSGLRGLITDLAADPDHPVREKAETALANLAFDLQHMPETRRKVERAKRELLANPAVADWLEGIGGQMQQGLARMLAGDGPSKLGDAAAQALREDPALAQEVNQLARRAIIGIVADHGSAIVALVSDTVKGWDAATVTDKLEGAVLRDLQYIRLNGTLIGGLIGLAIHAVVTMLHF